MIIISTRLIIIKIMITITVVHEIYLASKKTTVAAPTTITIAIITTASHPRILVAKSWPERTASAKKGRERNAATRDHDEDHH
jgi:hypothetical protein